VTLLQVTRDIVTSNTWYCGKHHVTSILWIQVRVHVRQRVRLDDVTATKRAIGKEFGDIRSASNTPHILRVWPSGRPQVFYRRSVLIWSFSLFIWWWMSWFSLISGKVSEKCRDFHWLAGKCLRNKSLFVRWWMSWFLLISGKVSEKQKFGWQARSWPGHLALPSSELISHTVCVFT
jgi:hypothetical protein